jgi:hypothetical protein
MQNTSSSLLIYSHNAVYATSISEVTDIRPDPELAGRLGIFHRSAYSIGSTSIEHYINALAFIPENAPLTAYLQTHYPEYFI